MINLNDEALREWVSKNTILCLLIMSLSANVYQYKEMMKEKDKALEHEQKQKEVLENILNRLVKDEKNSQNYDSQR